MSLEQKIIKVFGHINCILQIEKVMCDLVIAINSKDNKEIAFCAIDLEIGIDTLQAIVNGIKKEQHSLDWDTIKSHKVKRLENLVKN